MRWIFALIVLGGCAQLYWPEPQDGLTIKVRVHSDPDQLYNFCEGADACAITLGKICTIHLPERAGYMFQHELTHCMGRKDPPEIHR